MQELINIFKLKEEKDSNENGNFYENFDPNNNRDLKKDVNSNENKYPQNYVHL